MLSCAALSKGTHAVIVYPIFLTVLSFHTLPRLRELMLVYFHLSFWRFRAFIRCPVQGNTCWYIVTYPSDGSMLSYDALYKGTHDGIFYRILLTVHAIIRCLPECTLGRMDSYALA